MKKNILGVFCLFIFLTFCLTGMAMADYPTKPVVLVTYSSPGGGTDVFLRTLAKHMEPYIKGVSLVVENRPGGGGSTAMNYVATAKPDGYTLLGVTPNYLFTPLLGKTARSYRDLTAVVRAFVDPMLVYVKYDSPFNSLKDVIDAAKKNPGKQRWGSGAVGSSDQMVVYKIKTATNVNVATAPFEGGGDLLVAVLGGHVDLGVGEPGELMGQVDAKKVKILAVVTEKRLTTLPNVPTAQESSGYNIVIPEKFRGLVGPKGVSAEAMTWWEGKIQQVLKDPKYKSYYESVNLIPAFLGSKEFSANIEKENQIASEFLKEIGMFKEFKEKK